MSLPSLCVVALKGQFSQEETEARENGLLNPESTTKEGDSLSWPLHFSLGFQRKNLTDATLMSSHVLLG